MTPQEYTEMLKRYAIARLEDTDEIRYLAAAEYLERCPVSAEPTLNLFTSQFKELYNDAKKIAGMTAKAPGHYHAEVYLFLPNIYDQRGLGFSAMHEFAHAVSYSVIAQSFYPTMTQLMEGEHGPIWSSACKALGLIPFPGGPDMRQVIASPDAFDSRLEAVINNYQVEFNFHANSVAAL